MDISSFDDLLQAARMQPEPQRLLFVFAAVELPDDATPAQRARFEAGQGGALVPLMCVDKRPEEITGPWCSLQRCRARRVRPPAAPTPPRRRCAGWMPSRAARMVPTFRLTGRVSRSGSGERRDGHDLRLARFQCPFGGV